MREAGLRTWQDGVGNMHGRLDGRARDAPALLMGSHYDTVTDAGKYDGALGIVVAIAAVKALILQVGSPKTLKYPQNLAVGILSRLLLGPCPRPLPRSPCSALSARRLLEPGTPRPCAVKSAGGFCCSCSFLPRITCGRRLHGCRVESLLRLRTQ
jgi:hypothetical protein